MRVPLPVAAGYNPECFRHLALEYDPTREPSGSHRTQQRWKAKGLVLITYFINSKMSAPAGSRKALRHELKGASTRRAQTFERGPARDPSLTARFLSSRLLKNSGARLTLFSGQRKASQSKMVVIGNVNRLGRLQCISPCQSDQFRWHLPKTPFIRSLLVAGDVRGAVAAQVAPCGLTGSCISDVTNRTGGIVRQCRYRQGRSQQSRSAVQILIGDNFQGF